MRVFGWFTVGLTKGSQELVNGLLAIHPGGRRWTWPARDGSRREFFECQLPKDDPKLQELLHALAAHGFRLWAGRGRPAPEDISFEYRRKYDASDFDAAALLQPLPTHYVGSAGKRDAVGLMLLDPEPDLIREDLKGLKPLTIGHTSPTGLIVSTELKQRLQQRDLQGLVFKPILSEYDPVHGPIPDCWELTSALTLPPLANPELNEGFYTPAEFHYRASDLSPLGVFDLGVAVEHDRPVASQRFYRFCVEQQLEMTWEPVRVDSE